MEVARGTPPRFGNPAPSLTRVAAEVFRLASISRPLMRPQRGVGVSPPGIISRRRRIHPVDRNNNKQFSGPATTQLARPVRPYRFARRKDPRGRGEPGATHENHRGYAGDCKLPARSWNMYLSFQAAFLRLARTLAALDRSRPIRLSAILRTRARLRAAARSRTRLSSSRKVTSSTQCTAFSIDQ